MAQVGDRLGLQADGTYRIHQGGWTVAVLGTHSAYWNKKTHGASHSFRPIAYAFMKSESTLGYRVFFQATNDMVRDLFSQPLPAKVACSDRCEAIRQAFMAVWPEVSLYGLLVCAIA